MCGIIVDIVNCSVFLARCQNGILFLFWNSQKLISKELLETEIIFDWCQEINCFKLWQFSFHKISNKLCDTNNVFIVWISYSFVYVYGSNNCIDQGLADQNQSARKCKHDVFAQKFDFIRNPNIQKPLKTWSW